MDGVWGQHSLLLGSNVGSFPGKGGGERLWREADIVSRLRVIGAEPPSAFLVHSSVESRDMKDVENYRKGTRFMNRYCAIYSLYCCGQWVFYCLALFPVTLRPVVTFRKADRNWNFKGMKCISDTAIYHKPRSTALITSEKLRWEDRLDPTSTHLQAITNTLPGMWYGRTLYFIYLDCCTSCLIGR